MLYVFQRRITKLTLSSLGQSCCSMSKGRYVSVSATTEYLLKSLYIDSSVQKGGIPGVPECWEHNGVVTQLIREAREGKGDLSVLWLDLANAYDSIPHKLVESALERYHVPSNVKEHHGLL